MSRTPKTIFFDVGNTLLFPNRERTLAALSQRGVWPTPAQLAELERRTKKEFDEMLETTGHADHSFWHIFYTHLLEELDISDERVRDEMVEATRLSANWDSIRPGTCERLQQISKRYRIGVISNSDGKVSETLRNCGIGECFLSIVDSGNIGYEKPHPAIFEAALRDLRTRARGKLVCGRFLFRGLPGRYTRRHAGFAV